MSWRGVADLKCQRGKHGCEDQTAWEVAGREISSELYEVHGEALSTN